MQLPSHFNISTTSGELLPVFLIVFNLVPVCIFIMIMAFTLIINFGAALVVQMAAIVICLAWLLPTVFICSISAFLLCQMIQITQNLVRIYIDRRLTHAITTPLQKAF